MQGQKVEVGTPRRLRDEKVRVHRWRHEQFFKLGFTNSEARTLAESRADLTAARALVARGCDLPTAYQIIS